MVSGGSRGGGAREDGVPNSFNFMQFLGKFGKIVCWRPPGELARPLPGSPGSAIDGYHSSIGTMIIFGQK